MISIFFNEKWGFYQASLKDLLNTIPVSPYELFFISFCDLLTSFKPKRSLVKYQQTH
jgi:hypothetical protein